MKKKRFYLLLISIVFLSVAFFTGCNSMSNESKEIKVEEETNSESVYQTNGRWDNQYGDTLQLGKLVGKIPVVSMVFTRCAFACPRIIADIKAIEKQIPEDKKDKVVFVLVSFDSDRDHTHQLEEFAKQMQLNQKWLVLHGNEQDVRELSMLLDVKYKKQPNGDFTHSSSITLLSTKGAIVEQLEGLGVDPQLMIEKIKAL